MKLSRVFGTIVFGACLSVSSAFASSPIPLEVISEFHVAAHQLNKIVEISAIEPKTKAEVHDFMVASDNFVSCLSEFGIGHSFFFDKTACDPEKDIVLDTWMKVQHDLYDINGFLHPLVKNKYGHATQSIHNLFKYYGMDYTAEHQFED